MPPKNAQDDAADCIKKAKFDPEKIKSCEKAFTDAGGTIAVQEGGKVFSLPGNPDQIITTGGKVFQQKA
jgi:hypothetical protein